MVSSRDFLVELQESRQFAGEELGTQCVNLTPDRKEIPSQFGRERTRGFAHGDRATRSSGDYNTPRSVRSYTEYVEPGLRKNRRSRQAGAPSDEKWQAARQMWIVRVEPSGIILSRIQRDNCSSRGSCTSTDGRPQPVVVCFRCIALQKYWKGICPRANGATPTGNLHALPK